MQLGMLQGLGLVIQWVEVAGTGLQTLFPGSMLLSYPMLEPSPNQGQGTVQPPHC